MGLLDVFSAAASPTRTIALYSLVGLGTACGAYQLWQYRRALKQNDDQWFPVGRVAELFVHPIKSSRGISTFHLDIVPVGAHFNETYDRQFVVYNPKTDRFVTAGMEPKLVLVNARVENDTLHLESPKVENPVQVPLADVRKTARVCTVTLLDKLRADGLDCGDEAAQFVETALDYPGVRLALFVEGLANERAHRPRKEWSRSKQPDRVDNSMFANLSPIMIATNASLRDVNTKLDKPVTIRNFRPNIVVENCVAWDEDRWAEVRIGDVRIDCYRPCTRCIVTTVDPDEGVKHPEMQPFAKMKEFRQLPDEFRPTFKDSPVFGVKAGVRVAGRVHVGQTVYARYKPIPF